MPKVNLSCGYCGKQFTRYTPLDKRYIVSTCSAKCRGLLRRIDRNTRFWRHVDKRGPDECWLWTGHVNNGGYGQFHWSPDNKSMPAHRASYLIAKNVGPEVLGLDVICHGCDVRRCVNPVHLWAGTAKDNIQDCILKGRRIPKAGEDHPMAKLSWELVRYMRECQTKLTIALAEHTGVSDGLVRQILSRDIWKDADDPHQIRKEPTRKSA